MIDSFKATLGKRGFAKPTLFRVEFTSLPAVVLNREGVSAIVSDLHMFAESAEFPGTQILTQEVRHYDMPAKFAYGKAHEEITITFRLDRDFQIKKLFDIWTDSIYDKKTGNVYYKNVYSGGFKVYQLMENAKVSYGIELLEAYPTQVGQIALGWDQQGAYSRLPVTFTFKKIKPTAALESAMFSSNGPMGERTIPTDFNMKDTPLSSTNYLNLGQGASQFNLIKAPLESKITPMGQFSGLF